MKKFMDRDFLLETDTARHLYHDYAEGLPIIDYHCHISPKDIYENKRFTGLEEIWLGGRNPDGSVYGDHYKWRLMRAHGIDEAFITGDAPGREKIRKFAEALEYAVGNPMIAWTDLELKNFFGITEPLNSRNAGRIYDACNELLRTAPHTTPRGLIGSGNVVFIGTTDDPAEPLTWHEKIAADKTFHTAVCPSFRPDKVLNPQDKMFAPYVNKLGAAAGINSMSGIADLCAALSARLKDFVAHGCRAADLSLEHIPYAPCTEEAADAIMKKALRGGILSEEETEQFRTFMLLFLSKAYHNAGIVSQIHFSVYRNTNARLFKAIGPDIGVDMGTKTDCIIALGKLFSALDEEDALPRTILYSLDSSNDRPLAVLAGCFQRGSIPGKIQLGSAWWFNDTRSGMEHQLLSLAELGILGNFVGMLTDSRSFLSYARHEYFRRILCNTVGRLVENGEYPDDEEALKRIIEGVCYGNAKRFFNL